MMWPSPPHFFLLCLLVLVTSAGWASTTVFSDSSSKQRTLAPYFNGSTGFVIVTWPRIQQATWLHPLSIQHCCRLEPFRLHPDILAHPTPVKV